MPSPSTYTVSPLSLGTPINDTAASMVAAVDLDQFPNDGLTFLLLKNGGTAATVKANSVATGITSPGYGNVTITDTAISLPINTTLLVGPFGPSRFNTPSSMVVLNYTTPTTVTVKAVRFTPIS